MPSGGVRSIQIEGFTSIRSAKVRIGELNILVGANGSGKSNFVRALELLGRIVDGDLQLFVGVNGFGSLVHHLSPGTFTVVVDCPPVRYSATLIAAAEDRAVFADESVREGEEWRRLGRGHRESKLRDAAARAEPPGLAHLVRTLGDCRVYHFHDTSRTAPVKRHGPVADSIGLRSDAGNLAALLYRLREERHTAYQRILGAVRQVAPFFLNFVLRPTSSDQIQLRWRQVDSDVVFSADQLSDGTLRFICLATLLLSPELPRLVVLDEPELGLHPYAIVQLAGMLHSAATRAQVVVATQSVTLMNQFELPDLIVVERQHGASVFSRPNADRLQEWLADYSLGELWEKNLIRGRPTPEQPT